MSLLQSAGVLQILDGKLIIGNAGDPCCCDHDGGGGTGTPCMCVGQRIKVSFTGVTSYLGPLIEDINRNVMIGGESPGIFDATVSIDQAFADQYIVLQATNENPTRCIYRVSSYHFAGFKTVYHRDAGWSGTGEVTQCSRQIGWSIQDSYYDDPSDLETLGTRIPNTYDLLGTVDVLYTGIGEADYDNPSVTLEFLTIFAARFTWPPTSGDTVRVSNTAAPVYSSRPGSALLGWSDGTATIECTTEPVGFSVGELADDDCNPVAGTGKCIFPYIYQYECVSDTVYTDVMRLPGFCADPASYPVGWAHNTTSTSSTQRIVTFRQWVAGGDCTTGGSGATTLSFHVVETYQDVYGDPRSEEEWTGSGWTTTDGITFTGSVHYDNHYNTVRDDPNVSVTFDAASGMWIFSFYFAPTGNPKVPGTSTGASYDGSPNNPVFETFPYVPGSANMVATITVTTDNTPPTDCSTTTPPTDPDPPTPEQIAAFCEATP